jgi:hypothetical protein
MNEVAPKLGFYAAIIGFIAAVAYGSAQVAQITKIVSYPLADLWRVALHICTIADCDIGAPRYRTTEGLLGLRARGE